MKKHQANQLSTKNCNKKQLSERLKLIKKVIETKMDSVNVQRTKDVSETPKSNIVENADVSNSQVLYNVQEESGTSRTNQRLECIEEDADLSDTQVSDNSPGTSRTNQNRSEYVDSSDTQGSDNAHEESGTNRTNQNRLERIEADSERQMLLEILEGEDSDENNYEDEAPGPISTRASRFRLRTEEDLIKERHQHDMQIEKRQEDRKDKEQQERWELEKQREISRDKEKMERLELGKRRETRQEKEEQERLNIAQMQIEK